MIPARYRFVIYVAEGALALIVAGLVAFGVLSPEQLDAGLTALALTVAGLTNALAAGNISE